MIIDRHANLKYKYWNRQFRCEGYYVDTVGRNKKAIAQYIRNQLAEDKIYAKLTIKEYYDPFTGDPAKNSKQKQPHFVGLLVNLCARQTVSPRLEVRPLLCPYRACAGIPFYGWS